MKGDFSRSTFDARKHYSRVLMQQGRVAVDADSNDQADILLHLLRALACDLIGPYAAPAVGGGFQLGLDGNGRLTISAGRYYVDGILVENEIACLYSDQPAFHAPADDALGTAGDRLLVARGPEFTPGCWVELSDDTREFQGLPGVLVKLADADESTLFVDPASVPALQTLALPAPRHHPKVRRWDQAERRDAGLSSGAVPIAASRSGADGWIDLERGIQVRFKPGGTYRTGDYWLIPARAVPAVIEWPADSEGPQSIRPHGVVHHHAPLGFVSWKNRKLELEDCRRVLPPLANGLSRIRKRTSRSHRRRA